MTVQEALQNIDIVVSNVQMKRGEHAALQQSISLIAQRCKRADELEKDLEAGKELRKDPEEQHPEIPSDSLKKSVKVLTAIEAAKAKEKEEKR